jgi:hypothetical protein
MVIADFKKMKAITQIIFHFMKNKNAVYANCNLLM